MIHFLGLEPNVQPAVPARFVVLPVPCEMTVSYGHGTGQGPRAILEASEYLELYDEELGCEPWRAGIETAGSLPLGVGDPKDAVLAICDATRAIAVRSCIPVMLGGEHTVTVGAVKALKELYPGLIVVCFDAHADYRRQYQGSMWSHACTLRRVSEIAPVVALGVRSVSNEEMVEIRQASDYRLRFAHDLGSKEFIIDMIKQFGAGPLYLSIDLDAFDPSIMPAVGTPEPGGLSWRQMLDIVKSLCREFIVKGIDVVELAPIAGFNAPQFVAAKLVYKVIGYISEKMGFVTPDQHRELPSQ